MNFSLKPLFCAMLFVIVSLSCKEDKPERDLNDWRTPQYLEDSAICTQYIPMMDTILFNLPAGMKMTNQCPDEVKRQVKIFRDEQAYMIFTPQELNTRETEVSYFRYAPVQKDMSPGRIFFSWASLQGGYQTQQEIYFNLANEFREVITNRYICVFINDQKKYVVPEMDPVKEEYSPGEISGTAVIVDFVTGKPQCAFSVQAGSSDSVHVETFFDHGEYGADTSVLGDLANGATNNGVVVDLWYNLATAIQRKLNSSVWQ